MNSQTKNRSADKYELFVPISKLEKFSSALRLPEIVSRPVLKFLVALQEILGVKLGFHIPKELLLAEVELWDGLLTVRRLQELGIAISFSEHTKLYADEPGIYEYVIGVKDARFSGGDGGGYDFFSRKKALWASIGEAVERYALNHFLPPEGKYRDASYNELKPNCVDIFSIAGISPDQRQKNNFYGSLFFDENTAFRWVQGNSLTRKRKVWVPLQLISFAYASARQKAEPLILPAMSTGAAVHQTLEAAVLNGLLEVIQRDAFMVAWVNKLPVPRLEKTSIENEEIRQILKKLERYKLECHLLWLPSDTPTHTVLSVLIDRSGVGPAVSVGAGTDFDISKAILTALNESLAIRLSTRWLWNKWRKENGEALPDKNSLDREGRLIWWSVPERIGDTSFLLKGKEKPLSELAQYEPPLNKGEAVAKLVRVFGEKGLEVVATEILGENFKKPLGLHGVMVTIPGMQPLHLDERLPFLYGDRMQTLPKKFGFSAAARPNELPSPFP